MSERQNRHLVLAERPDGPVTDTTFELRTEPVPDPGPDEMLIRTVWVSCDPAQRGWLNDVRSYVPPVQIGETMRAGGVGRVEASNLDGFAPGDWVQGSLGWREWMLTDGTTPLGRINKVPPSVPDPKMMLSVLGGTGLTAYFGLLDLGRPADGDVVFVSGAAGATGSVAGQIARIKGATVIGTAGGPDKCAWVTDVAGYHHCIDYRSDDVGARLRSLAPDGLDVYFDNVGGEILDAALANLAQSARIVLCGGISSGYGAGQPPPGPRNYFQLVITRSRMEGFIVTDYASRFREAVDELAGWVADGSLRYTETVTEGLEQAPQALQGLFESKNLGKQLVQVSEP